MFVVNIFICFTYSYNERKAINHVNYSTTLINTFKILKSRRGKLPNRYLTFRRTYITEILKDYISLNAYWPDTIFSMEKLDIVLIIWDLCNIVVSFLFKTSYIHTYLHSFFKQSTVFQVVIYLRETETTTPPPPPHLSTVSWVG